MNWSDRSSHRRKLAYAQANQHQTNRLYLINSVQLPATKIRAEPETTLKNLGPS